MIATPALFEALVDDVLRDVAGWLVYRQDLLNFGLVCRRTWPLVVPRLYEHLEFRDWSWSPVLETLEARPDYAAHVRSLKLHTQAAGPPSSSALSYTLVRVIKHMPLLDTFVWDLSWHMHSSLWDLLRTRPTRLKTFGFCFESSAERMRDMMDVRHLHLRFTDYYNLHQDHPDVIAMWDAIRTSCPQLEEVTFTGSDTAAAYGSVRQFMGSEWPSIRRLAVGEIAFERPSPTQLGSTFKSQFFRFLESHDSIEDLHLSGKVHLAPSVFTAMSRSALSNLKYFRGSIFQVGTLRVGYASLRSLHIAEPLQLNNGIAGGIVQVLSKFRGVTDLQLSFISQDAEDKGDMLHAMFAVCPQLLFLSLSVTVCPVVTMVHLCQIVQEAVPLLKTLTLNIVPFSQDSLLEGVPNRLVSCLSRLGQLNISYLQAGDTFVEQDLPVPIRLGEYEILRSVKGRVFIVTHFEGVLFKPHSRHTRASAFGETSYRRPGGCRRRWFPRAGWVWYQVESQPSVWSALTFRLPHWPLSMLLRLWMSAGLIAFIALLYGRSSLLKEPS